MIEAPEARCLALQLETTLRGRRIAEVILLDTPHKFAFVTPGVDYNAQLSGKTVGGVRAIGGMVEITAGDSILLLSDGVNLRYLGPGADLPRKHQLLVGFEDESCLIVSIRMYGGILCFRQGCFRGTLEPYYRSAAEKPQVLSDAFDAPYFARLIEAGAEQKRSAKAFLATGQTIPGLGNGVLQDVLYRAGIHPKTKVGNLSSAQRDGLFRSIKDTLGEMWQAGGRDCETDLFGLPGGYRCLMSTQTAGEPCPRCGSTICKENYLGGSIYYCPGCQRR